MLNQKQCNNFKSTVIKVINTNFMLYTEGFTLFILSDAIINFKIMSLHFGPLFGQSLTLKWEVELISNCDYTDVLQSVGGGHDVVVTIA